MIVSENVPLSKYTTFRTGGNARYHIACNNAHEVFDAVDFALQRSLPWYVLGQGSNVLAPDEGYEGVLITIINNFIHYQEEGNTVVVTAGAGVSWDTLVQETVQRNLWGIENLAGIPGTVGASPVQNIGAYGVEIKDSFVRAQVCDIGRGIAFDVDTSFCAFGYRDSIFKRNKNLIICSVSFLLAKNGNAKTTYADVQKAVMAGADVSTPLVVANLIRTIRSKKFPDLAIYGTAGSFFKNPIITHEAYTRLCDSLGEIPSYSAEDGVKVPLAFILDKVLALRGFRMGHAWLFDAQPLVLVLDANGTSEEVITLAKYIATIVKEKTNIEIEFEVRAIKNNL